MGLLYDLSPPKSARLHAVIGQSAAVGKNNKKRKNQGVLAAKENELHVQSQ